VGGVTSAEPAASLRLMLGRDAGTGAGDPRGVVNPTLSDRRQHGAARRR
jgi:hypothetical protein